MQEILATKKFGPEQARFTQLKALNGFQSIACFAWALLLIFITHSRWDEQPPITAYSKAAISNSIGPACGFEALKNISYPAQVHSELQPCAQSGGTWQLLVALSEGYSIGANAVLPLLILHSMWACRPLPYTNAKHVLQVLAKSCKMLPVMIMGTLVGGKRYSSIEYTCALTLAAGISLFAQKSSSKVEMKLYTPNAPLGYLLCLANLIFDGYTNVAQVRAGLQLHCAPVT